MTDKTLILTIGTNRADMELLEKQLSQEGYETVSAASLDELDKIMAAGHKIALALIELAGLDKFIWERCAELNKNKIPFLVIAPQRSPTIQRDSMRHGASGLLVKPVGMKELMEYVHTLLGD